MKLPRIPRKIIHPLLLILTVYTTLLAGASMQGIFSLVPGLEVIRAGWTFSLTLLIILGCHELGHYLVARFHGANVSLPYFIPAPPGLTFIGTFGAFIRMRSPVFSKTALLQIGVAGPIASFVLSVMAILLGYAFLDPVQANEHIALVHDRMGIDMHAGEGVALSMGTSIIFWGLARLFDAPVAMSEIYHFPVLFAGWIGLLVTALNLIPIGQLDGGHIGYAIWGRLHRPIGYILTACLFALGFLAANWFIWAMLVFLLARFPHPPMVDAHQSLDRKSTAFAFSALVMLIVSFVPVPFSL